jgi:uncharacterized phage protein (TIGR02218 family)
VTATLTAGFQNHLKGRSHQRCSMLRLTLRDGTVLGFTDHDRVLAFDLGDGVGEVDYRPDFGMKLSNVQTGCGLDAGNFEVRFPIALAPRPFTREAVMGGRFHYCEARLFQVIWSDLTLGGRKFMRGNAGEWRVEGDVAIAEVRDQRDKLNQDTGRVVSNQCDADYADQVKCFAVPTEITGTVTHVDSAMQVTVSFAGSYANNFFNRGLLIGLTGANAGTKAVPIDTWTAAGLVKLYWPLVSMPQVGDTFTVRDGCARTRAACMAHDAILWFRGFPEVPGTQAMKPAIPSQAGGGDGKGGK